MKKDTRIITGITLFFLVIAGILFLWQQGKLASTDRTDAGASSVFLTSDRFSAAASDSEGGGSAQDSAPAEEQQECAVYVSGAVKHPGLYRYRGKARIGDAIEGVGGFRKNAAKNCVNLAALLTDGEQIDILTKKQAASAETAAAQKETSGGTTEKEGSVSGLININSADAQELMTLPGIGEAKAAQIIEYRTEHGSFGKPEDIMNISGIKEGVYSQMKDLITV